MVRHRIAWLPGDGIGPEVLEATRPVLDASGFKADFLPGHIGWELWKREGTPLPDRTIELLRNTDCAFLGAVTSKPGPDAQAELLPAIRAKGARYSSAVLRIRRLFDLYVCLRPCRAFPGNPQNHREGIDITIFRENTEGMYAGIEWERVPQDFFLVRGAERVPRQAAVTVRSITRKASLRIARAAFEHAAGGPRWWVGGGTARTEGSRRRVTAVHKANVMRATDGLFLGAVREVAGRYPSVEYEEMLVDSCALQLLRDPLRFDILLTTNLFGDILSDLCAGLVGGMGFAPSANIGTGYAMFEPAHGSAPDIAGKGVANPIAAILSAGMMLDWLGAAEQAKNIQRAVSEVVSEGKFRTPDMGGSSSTMEIASAVCNKL